MNKFRDLGICQWFLKLAK